jgi:hypothetical protein
MMPQKLSLATLYEADFYAWTQQQVALLRDRNWNQLDLVNLIEEMDSLGKQQRQELRNRLSLLIAHLLKWQFQPQRRSRSWLATMRIQRLDIGELLAENPSLRPYLEEMQQKIYLRAVELAVMETGLAYANFPLQLPYPLAEILDDRFYPGTPSDLLLDLDAET